jgi:predicted transcriptional regulator
MTVRDARLTRLELDIMKVLWETGPTPVQAVRDRLAAAGRDLAYNTVQTMLNVLHRKGRVRRERAGRAFSYAPVTTRMFDGRAEDLVMSLVETRRLTPETLSRLSRLLDEEKGGGHGRR